ncbi:hypothetical protein FJ987_24325 [Mesorhizobium sp. CU2]|uniref:hypothetical protein n=1 Tax=unclassified Mesorhizobium TaxID=325217 RepID=UPI001126791F|nr:MULTISPECIES: hypothetical protein [unclassified Mesorhizobium]TPN89366.1 hypothetical protein FJ988_00115 [Mesorhizobium sp. CU3]TPO07503.1 hypothetical protein FJ987_24325 [Mesorhizobium sp. CU2]
MTRKPILLFAFPALVLLLLAAERVASMLLGFYPASPAVWHAWLELRPFSTTFWQQVHAYLGGSLAIDAAILVFAAGACWMVCQARRSAGFFLANHAAMMFAGLMMALSSHAETASTIAAFTMSPRLQFSVMVDFNLQNCLVLCLGLAACAYCHVTFLREAKARAETRAVRMLALQRDL